MLKIKSKAKSKKLNEKKPINTKRRTSQTQQVQQEPIVFENIPIVFSWSTVDFIKKPLTEFYFAIAAIGAMAMVGWGIYNKNFIMAITFTLMIAVIILALNEEPKKMDVVISEKGIDINGEHYNFSDFRSFRISYADGIPALILANRKSFSQFKTIYLENEPVNDLESFLGIFIEKEEDAVKV